MLGVEDYLQIRLLHRDGTSARKIARELGHGRETVRRVLETGIPPGYRLSRPRAAPLLGPFLAIIDQILESDGDSPVKQRHTAMRIWQRLKQEHGYAGGYDQVRRYVKHKGRRSAETHVPLEYWPGERLECDFGEISVDFPEGRRKVAVLVAVWSFSQYPFLIALPDQSFESIQHGMICAFEFFGCVPREVWWDNPRTLAALVLRGRERKLHPLYAALASHYRFNPMFCMPRKGQEKSDAERTVFALERRFGTPVPRVADLDELNRLLVAFCLKERERMVAGRLETIGIQFQREQLQATSLPQRPLDGCVREERLADKYQCVTFQNIRYSVPRSAAFKPVTVKAYMDAIVLVCEGKVVAQHPRLREVGKDSLDPLHYLEVLKRKPAYLEKTRVFREAKLPASFARLRQELVGRWGEREGKRQYIEVLQLLTSHPPASVDQAIEACLQVAGTQPPAACGVRRQLLPEPTGATGNVQVVQVRAPNLKAFDALLSGE